MKIDKFSELRQILLRQAKRNPQHAFHIRSNLNWERYKKQANLLAKILPKGQRVLDLGCGWGQTTAMLAILRPDLEILGIDLDMSPTWAELEKYGCRFRVGDALDLRTGDEEFDSAVSFGVMEHVDDRKFLKEVYRVLRPGGYNILFNLPSRYSLSELFAGALGVWHHEQRYTKRQVTRLFVYSGFEVLEIEREHVAPAQVGRISGALENFFNQHYLGIGKLDTFLNITPLNFFSQAFTVISRKVSR